MFALLRSGKVYVSNEDVPDNREIEKKFSVDSKISESSVFECSLVNTKWARNICCQKLGLDLPNFMEMRQKS